MNYEIIKNISLVTFGLGIFLFGIKSIGFYIRAVLEKRLQDYIKYWVKTKFLSVLTGFFSIILTQSGITVIIILLGALKSNLISRKEAAYTLIGANLGIAAVIYLISLDVSLVFNILTAIACIIYFLSESVKIKNVAGIFFSIGFVYFGLNTIQANLTNLIAMFPEGAVFGLTSSLLVNFFSGLIFTFILNSIIAVVVVAIAMMRSGLLDLYDLMILICGANVGIVLLMLISTFKTSGMLKQIIFYNIISKLLGIACFMLLFFCEIGLKIPILIDLTQRLFQDPGIQVTFLYFAFSAIPLIFIIPLQDRMMMVLERWCPQTLEDIFSRPQFLTDTKLLDSESIIQMIELEQIRVIKAFELYFDELRGTANFKRLTAISNSLNQLTYFIKDEISNLTRKNVLSLNEHDAIYHLLARENIIKQCHKVLLELSAQMLRLKNNPLLKNCLDAIVEALDIINLLLIDVTQEGGTGEDLAYIKTLAVSEKGAGARLRSIYLKYEDKLSGSERAEFLEILNQTDILIFLFLDLARKFAVK